MILNRYRPFTCAQPARHFDHADSNSATLAGTAYAPLPSAGPRAQPPRRPKVPLYPTIFTWPPLRGAWWWRSARSAAGHG